MKTEPFADTRCTLGECTQRLVREDPVKAVGLALLGGMLVTVLPVRRLLGAFASLLLALAQPLLLALGIVKLCETCERKPEP